MTEPDPGPDADDRPLFRDGLTVPLTDRTAGGCRNQGSSVNTGDLAFPASCGMTCVQGRSA